ncbi:hypothetical protein [Candidatus Poriferisodalis sp.]|uniref:hypothetical protein n=1 Tax=Candidatus Poriferisodalis sp. TaxID=3101277 RepID=UPI003B5283EB
MGNRLTRLTIGDAEKLEIDSVSIGTPSPVPGTAATVNIVDGEDDARMSVTAKQTGAAKGASGNGWKIYGYADPDASTAPLPASANISVEVDMRHRIIAYTVNKIGQGAELADAVRACTGPGQQRSVRCELHRVVHRPG